jgi:predicted nucleic acid-binding protein
MVLVDTSVWIDHLHRGEARLSKLLDAGEVVIHPFVIGELACGNLKNRSEILTLLAELPEASRVGDNEVLLFLEHHKLAGCGLGLVDVHLLASCRMDSLPIWTKDARLKSTATRIGLAVK